MSFVITCNICHECLHTVDLSSGIGDTNIYVLIDNNINPINLRRTINSL
jgi:hypothetical protein